MSTKKQKQSNFQTSDTIKFKFLTEDDVNGKPFRTTH